MLAADGCASSSGNPACCFCGVWVPGGPREWRSPCSGFHWFGHAHLPVLWTTRQRPSSATCLVTTEEYQHGQKLELAGRRGRDWGPSATESGHMVLNRSPTFSSLLLVDISRSGPASVCASA